MKYLVVWIGTVISGPILLVGSWFMLVLAPFVVVAIVPVALVGLVLFRPWSKASEERKAIQVQDNPSNIQLAMVGGRQWRRTPNVLHDIGTIHSIKLNQVIESEYSRFND